MSKKTRRIAGEPTGFERVLERAEQSPVGFHDLRSPAEHTTTGLPPGAAEMYLWFDGGGLFFDTVTIVAAQDCVRSEETGRWQLGELDGHAIELDQAGRVWRLEGSLDAWLVDGTTLDRWLAGCLEGYAHMYDGDGEFADEVFDEDGELTDAAQELGLRARLKRDERAPGLRWQLAQCLLERGEQEAARRELERVTEVDDTPPWAWLDLAKISEELGELANAVDEATAAAEGAVGGDQEAYFWAQVARLAARASDEGTRQAAADRVAAVGATLRTSMLAGAQASLAEADHASAAGVLELLRAVWPKDLEVLDLTRRLKAATTTTSS